MKRIKLILIVLCVMLCFSGSAQAMFEPLGDSGWAIVTTPAMAGAVDMPYIYDITSNSVIIELDKTFRNPPDQDGIFTPIIIEFMKLASDAVANIVIKDEYIINNTGAEWFDFHMYLMVDVIHPQAGFDSAFYPDGGQLENVYYEGPFGFNGMPIQLNFEDTNGHGVVSWPPGEDVFQPGYVVGEIVIVTDPMMPVGNRFGLKEIPTTIPEPTTVVLLGLATLGFLHKKKG